jgi:hypothetical protein
MANGLEPTWRTVAEVSGTKIAGTLVAEAGQQVSSAQSFGAVATGTLLPQFIPMGMADGGMGMPLAWVQQSITRWLPQAVWPQAISASAG